MANDKSNKELKKSTMRVPSFNMILRQVLVVNAYGDKRLCDNIDLENALLYNTIRQLNFSKDSNEVRKLLSNLLELTGGHDSYVVEEVLLDFVIGKGCTECSKAVCEKVFGKQPTFADMMRHRWFKHLMGHPIETKPYSPGYNMVRDDDANYWHNFHFMLSSHFQTGSSLALEVLEHLAEKGDVLAMQRIALYYFSKSQSAKAFPLLERLHAKAQAPEWKDVISQEVTYTLGKLYSLGLGTEQNNDKAKQCFNELDDDYSWGRLAKYQLGRIAEQNHRYIEAMYYYRENIDYYTYSRYSSYRDSYPNNLLPRRLEIAFRNLKKKLYPMVDSLKLVTCQGCDNIELQLKVMMNARVTIEWGDGETETIKWKVDGWEGVNHAFLPSGSHIITISTDEENVLTGIHAISSKSIVSLDVSDCRGLTHMICPDQQLEHLSLEKAEYLSVLDVHGNLLQSINLRRNELLTVVDCSRNPLRKIGITKHPPLRMVSVRKTRLTAKAKRKIHAITHLNAGKMLSEGFVSQLTQPVLPTLLYYIKNCSWEEVLPFLLQECCGKEKERQNLQTMRKFFKVLKSYRQIVPCRYPDGFLWVSDTWVVIAHRFAAKKTGQIIEDMMWDQEFYLHDQSWSMILGTPVKAKENRLPFMMLPQRPKAYLVAMCLYNLMYNYTEMRKHGIPKCFSFIYT